MVDKAYGKINLSLGVIGKREDGYHELSMIMLPIDFYDDLSIEIASKDEYISNVEMIFDENNSIIKMINLLKDKFDIKDHYKIKLFKRIPALAGLGGGTADAASTLRIFEKLYDLKLSEDEIKELCLKVGADVYFNYINKPSLVTGIGDIIEPFEIKKDYYFLLLKPDKGVSTKLCFEMIDGTEYEIPDNEEIIKRIQNNEDFSSLLINSLEGSAIKLVNEIDELKKELIKKGAKNVLMSGSGSSVFAIDSDFEKMRELSQSFKNTKEYIAFGKILH